MDSQNKITNHLNKPIVFIGLMAAGKTKLGKLLARHLELDFFDSDKEIEKVAGCRIADIFDRYGEEEFRRLEGLQIKKLLEGTPKIIATGGGAVMTAESAALIWDKSISIWLKADLQTLIGRLEGDSKRPLLQGHDLSTRLQGLMDERYDTYAKADITVDSSNDDRAKVLETVLESLQDYLIGKENHA